MKKKWWRYLIAGVVGALLVVGFFWVSNIINIRRVYRIPVSPLINSYKENLLAFIKKYDKHYVYVTGKVYDVREFSSKGYVLLVGTENIGSYVELIDPNFEMTNADKYENNSIRCAMDDKYLKLFETGDIVTIKGMLHVNTTEVVLKDCIKVKDSNPIQSTSEKEQKEELTGNSVGNIMNSGLADIEGEWIYYINTNNGNKIYKILTDGSKRQQINTDFSRCINVVGDWIFYFKYLEDSEKIREYCIYKIRTDGTERQKVATAGSFSYFIVDGWIYYSNSFDGYKLYRIKIDGSQNQKLAEDNVGSFNVVNDWIYFRADKKLCKICIDGSCREIIEGVDSYSFNVVGDWIYYSNLNDSQILYEIETDGSLRKKLNDVASYCVNVSGNWIYYCSINEGYHLYKIYEDGTKNQILNADDTWNPNVVGEWIYYQNRNEDFSLYRIRTDGSERQKVE
jgi:hypothetical protein